MLIAQALQTPSVAFRGLPTPLHRTAKRGEMIAALQAWAAESNDDFVMYIEKDDVFFAQQMARSFTATQTCTASAEPTGAKFEVFGYGNRRTFTFSSM